MEKKIQTIASLNTMSFSAHLDKALLRKGEVSKRIRIDYPKASAIIPFVSQERPDSGRKNHYRPLHYGTYGT